MNVHVVITSGVTIYTRKPGFDVPFHIGIAIYEHLLIQIYTMKSKLPCKSLLIKDLTMQHSLPDKCLINQTDNASDNSHLKGYNIPSDQVIV